MGARALAELPGADYADAFRIGPASGRSAREWARRCIESGPPAPRRAFGLLVWQGVLGFRLAPPATPGTMAGWRIVEDEPDRFVLATDGRLIAARMVFDATDTDLTWTTLLRYHRSVAAGVWAVAGHGHRALVPRLLWRARGRQ